VFIQVYGEKGDSGKKKLDNHRNNFERGRVDEFSFDCIDLGFYPSTFSSHYAI